MENSKALEFFRGVAEKTERRRIPWQPTATDDLVAAIGGEFTLRLFPYGRDVPDGPFYALELHDTQGRELIRLDSERGDVRWDELRRLYEAAKQQGLQVDEKVDKLLGVLERL